MKVCVLFSGGKDSTYTLWLALHQFNVKFIVTVLSTEESFLYHYQKENVVQTLADAIGIPFKIVKISPEEDELNELEKAIKSLYIEAICIGQFPKPSLLGLCFTSREIDHFEAKQPYLEC